MPNTCVTPHAIIVSTMRSEIVRDACVLGREPDVHAVGAHLDGMPSGRIRETGRGSARDRVVVVPVPRAPQPRTSMGRLHARLPFGRLCCRLPFDRTLAEGPALVRAVIVERAVLAVEVRERERRAARGHGHHAPVGERVELGDLVPHERLGRGRAHRTPAYSTPESAAISRSKVERSLSAKCDR